jgi:response regulator RpfG family c-di-GMP phosphodiesterase
MSAARILVVDNESIIAKSIENRLKRAGYTTLGIALSGVDAIQLSCELQPDLILMDIVMDDEFDGIQATARIHDFLDVPVIYITAHDDEEHLKRATETEPYGYLIKPIEINVLRSAIEVALHKHTVERKLKQQLQSLTATRAMDQAILSLQDLSSALEIFLQQIASSLSMDGVRILLVDHTGQHFECAGVLGFQNAGERTFQSQVDENYARLVAQQDGRVFIQKLDIQTEEACPVWLQYENFVTYIGVPLVNSNVLKGVLELFHRSEFEPDADWLETLRALAGQVNVALEHFGLLERLRRTNQELIQSYDATIQGWSQALELRDQETQGHSRRVTELTVNLAVALNYPENKLVNLRRGALLHDIGKMGIPDKSLLKEGPLDETEWEVMRRHPKYAFDLLKGIPFLEEALEIPYCHHEKWDGTGYPRGLVGEEIPLAARIFTVVDFWDALSSDRCYRKAWPRGKAIEYIREHSGKFFDPRVVDAFLKLVDVDNDLKASIS